MVNDILSSAEERLNKSIDALKREFGSLRAGRATPSLLDKVMVDYYGTPTPVNQVAKVSVPEARMIVIQPWEKTMIKEIEKAYMSGCSGHTHRLAKFITRKSGRKFVWAEGGCLCDLEPEYCINPDWQQGFVRIDVEKSRIKSLKAIEIEKGEVLE